MRDSNLISRIEKFPKDVSSKKLVKSDKSPFLTIITVVFNAKDKLRNTLESIRNQQFSDKEVVVIDGGSSDGTLEILLEFSDIIDYQISEPDHGIYDAMNKGIRAAKGKYLHFLNSGDIFYSPASLIHACGSISLSNHNLYKFQFVNRAILTERMSLIFLLRYTFNHQSVIYDRSLFDKFQYDITMELAADYVHLIAIYKRLKIGYFDFPLIVFDQDFSATNRKNIAVIWKERAKGIAKTNELPGYFKVIAWPIAYFLYKLRAIIN